MVSGSKIIIKLDWETADMIYYYGIQCIKVSAPTILSTLISWTLNNIPICANPDKLYDILLSSACQQKLKKM
jgi:hypothetical protein